MLKLTLTTIAIQPLLPGKNFVQKYMWIPFFTRLGICIIDLGVMQKNWNCMEKNISQEDIEIFVGQFW